MHYHAIYDIENWRTLGDMQAFDYTNDCTKKNFPVKCFYDPSAL